MPRRPVVGRRTDVHIVPIGASEHHDLLAARASAYSICMNPLSTRRRRLDRGGAVDHAERLAVIDHVQQGCAKDVAVAEQKSRAVRTREQVQPRPLEHRGDAQRMRPGGRPVARSRTPRRRTQRAHTRTPAVTRCRNRSGEDAAVAPRLRHLKPSNPERALTGEAGRANLTVPQSMKITADQLAQQVALARSRGWLQPIARAEKRHKLPQGMLLAIASRETNMQHRRRRRSRPRPLPDRRPFPRRLAREARRARRRNDAADQGRCRVRGGIARVEPRVRQKKRSARTSRSASRRPRTTPAAAARSPDSRRATAT